MNKTLLRRIIAWIGVVAAVAFAPLLVLNFYNFGEAANALIDAFLWTSLALAIIAFGLTRFIIDGRPKVDLGDAPLGDAGEAYDGEGDVEHGDDDVPDSEGNKDGKDEDDGGGN